MTISIAWRCAKNWTTSGKGSSAKSSSVFCDSAASNRGGSSSPSATPRRWLGSRRAGSRGKARNDQSALPASDAPVGTLPGHRRGDALQPNKLGGAALPQPPLLEKRFTFEHLRYVFERKIDGGIGQETGPNIRAIEAFGQETGPNIGAISA